MKQKRMSLIKKIIRIIGSVYRTDSKNYSNYASLMEFVNSEKLF